MADNGIYNELLVKTIYGEKKVFLPAAFFCTDSLPQRLYKYHEPEVHLLRGGAARFNVGGEVCEVPAGCMLVVPGGMFRSCEARAEGAQHIVFRVESVVRRARLYSLGSELTDSIFEAFAACAAGGDAVEPAAYIALLCSRFCVGEPPVLQPVEDYDVRLNEFFARRYGEKLQMKDLAQTLGITPRHAERLVLQHSGNTFGKELTLTRAEAARQLLREMQLTPEEIAAQTGYASAAAFDRAMKRYGIWDVRLCEQETDTQEEAPAGGMDAFEEEPEE